MGKKEKYQKELDLLLEKLRFWRYVLFAIFSGAMGVLFSLSQKKVIINSLLAFLFLFSFFISLIAVIRISILTKKYYFYLDLLEKEN